MVLDMIRLRVPGRLRYRDLAVRAVAAACKLVGTDGDTSHSGFTRINHEFDDQVVSAFGEAFNNVAIHGYRGKPVGDVEIDIEPRKDGIRIVMRDFGTSYELDRIPLPDLDAMPESGLGIYIMKSFVDEVTYQAGNPNVLSLTKRLMK